MKKLTHYSLLLAGTLGALAISQNSSAAETPGCQAMQSGCCGAQPMANEAASTAKPDLLTTCPVSGEKLGEMGKPFTFVYKDQEVKLCCKSCKKDFDKDPEKYMKLIRAADKK